MFVLILLHILNQIIFLWYLVKLEKGQLYYSHSKEEARSEEKTHSKEGKEDRCLNIPGTMFGDFCIILDSQPSGI
jgi:hypothetical protein